MLGTVGYKITYEMQTRCTQNVVDGIKVEDIGYHIALCEAND